MACNFYLNKAVKNNLKQKQQNWPFCEPEKSG